MASPLPKNPIVPESAPAPSSRPLTGPMVAFRHAGDMVAGRYRLLRAVGGGAMGALFAAEDTWRGEHVAVKMVRADLGEPTFYGELLAREARFAGRIEHPNVCRVLETGRDGHHFMIMELLEGESLEERMLRAPLTLDEAVRILGEVAAGLDAVHTAGIVHRDLKPGNIFIEAATGRAKIIDFGIAAPSNAKHGEAEPTGTPAFWSPEQARGEPPRPASDIYALGRTAYSLLANVPLEAESPIDLERIPPAFRELVCKCLAELPVHRFGRAEEFRAALARAVEANRPAFGLLGKARLGLTLVFAVLGIGAVVHERPAPVRPNARSLAPTVA